MRDVSVVLLIIIDLSIKTNPTQFIHTVIINTIQCRGWDRSMAAVLYRNFNFLTRSAVLVCCVGVICGAVVMWCGGVIAIRRYNSNPIQLVFV